MAIIKKTISADAPAKAAPVVTPAKSAASMGLSLPTERNVPSDDLGQYSILLYGAKKIGKTSFAARFPDAIFLSLEPGTKALSVFSRPVNSWDELIGYVELLEKDTKFRTVVIDTIDLGYEYAFEMICKKKMIAHPHEENDFGATWKEISEAFRKMVLRLINTGKGIIFISHDIEREIELRDGSKIDRVQPTMAKQAMSVVEALVDIICNYGYDGEKRVIRIDGSQSMVAGCRVEEHFVRKGGQPATPGDRILAIDMGRSAEEGYKNFIAAFNNEQLTVEPVVAKPTVVKKTT